MKIVSIGPAPPWRGGIAQYHFALVNALQALGAGVEVVTFQRLYPRLLFPGTDPRDRSPGSLPPLGEEVLRPLAPRSWGKAARLISGHRPDLILFHWWHPFFAPAYLGVLRALGRRQPLPRIGMICHNIQSHEGMIGGTWLARKMLRKTGFAITGGASMAEEARSFNPRIETAVVHHPAYVLPGMPDPPSKEEARRILGLPEGGVVFLFFGLVREYKGLDTLIEALGQLGSSHAWSCVVAGEFYQSRIPYEERISELGLEDRVRIEDRFIPPEEAPAFFAAADATVLPYHHATQSGVAALSFAMHRPVVTTAVGSLPEMITEGVNGWLVPPGEPGALADRLARLAEDPGRAQLPVCEGESGIPSWEDLARTVLDLAGDSEDSAS